MSFSGLWRRWRKKDDWRKPYRNAARMQVDGDLERAYDALENGAYWLWEVMTDEEKAGYKDRLMGEISERCDWILRNDPMFNDVVD